jgi:threonine/homoserine/homoserine lactone efflux protein
LVIFFLLQGMTLGLSAAASPGPFQAYLLSQTLQTGWRRALPAAFAPLVSDGPIILLTLALLTRAPGRFLQLVQIGGGIFLLYLAWGAWRTFRADPSAPILPNNAPGVQRAAFLKGAALNALSPGPYIFWGILAGPIFLEGWRMAPAVGLSFMGGFYAALIGGFAGLILLFALVRQLGPRIVRGLNGLSAVALFLFGLYQLSQGLLSG